MMYWGCNCAPQNLRANFRLGAIYLFATGPDWTKGMDVVGIVEGQSMTYRPLVWRLFFYGGLSLLLFVTKEIRFLNLLHKAFTGSPRTILENLRNFLRQQ